MNAKTEIIGLQTLFSPLLKEYAIKECQRNVTPPIIFRIMEYIDEGLLQNSWTHLITPSRNFVEVQWRSLFRSTSLRKRCTYNAPLTSQKRAADRVSLRNLLPRSSLFMVGKAQKSQGARSELNSVFDLEKVGRWNPIRTSTLQSRTFQTALVFSFNEKCTWKYK
jgi:hypothetical protein